MKDHRIFAAVPIITIVLTFASWTLLKATTVDKSEQAELKGILRQAEVYQAEMQKELMDLNYGRSWSFFELTAMQRRLEDLLMDLCVNLEAISPELLEQTKAGLGSVNKNIEIFKTNLAIVRNSKAYLQTNIEKRLEHSDGRASVSETLRLFQLYKGTENSGISSLLHEVPGPLDAGLTGLLSGIESDQKKRQLERHFRLLKLSQTKIDKALRATTASIASSLAPAEEALERFSLEIEDKSSLSRNIALALLSLSILLVVIVSTLLMRIAKYAKIKETMNDELQRRVEETTKELQIKTDEAVAANSLKSEFLANMSHEIRTPLNGILGMAQILQRSDLNEKQKRQLSTIRSSGDSLLSIINDVLDISKIESGLMKLENEPFDLRSLLQQAEEAVTGIAKQKNIGLTSACLIEGDVTFLGDEKRIRQVLINLTGNAVKFTDEGGVTVKATRLESGFVKFSVTDTGPGIAADQLKAVFGRFTQADGSATRKHGGTGLGLAISSDLVGLMEGEIGVDSELSKGSTFWFTLPLQKAKKEQPQIIETIAQKPLAEAPIGEKAPSGLFNILIAEDNTVNQEMLLEALEFIDGVRPVVVENGQEALDRLEEESFDLILMDINMPVMTGDEAIKRIRQSGRSYAELPILVLTANALAGQREEYLNVGATGYIAKPINVERLIATVEQFLTRTDNVSVA